MKTLITHATTRRYRLRHAGLAALAGAVSGFSCATLVHLLGV